MTAKKAEAKPVEPSIPLVSTVDDLVAEAKDADKSKKKGS